MDPLSDILSQLKPASFGFRGLDAAGSWALSFAPVEGVRCIALEQGDCWMSGLGSPIRVMAGDVMLLTRAASVDLYSDAESPRLDAYAFFSTVAPGEIARINGGGACAGVGGYFDFEGTYSETLLNALPPIVHVRSEASKAALKASIERLMRELRQPQPGSTLLAHHMAQALLIEVLRAHLDDAPSGASWLAGLADQRLHKALAALHSDVRRRWTVQSIAEIAGMSRSSFAAHFAMVIGETPIDYLTRWRMIVAMERLSIGREPLASVAAAVGYDSENAFGVAFKRVTGISPRRFGHRHPN